MPKSVASLLQQLLLPLLYLCLLHSADAYFSYRDRIPNGHRVPSPCEQGAVWDGVGHESSGGGGARNPFGRDFAAAGHRWTEQLCRRDSDGDGRSNGEELGDPDCVWREGGQPARTSGISHPGVCPLDSDRCSNDWDVCPKRFNCPSFQKEGVFVRNFTLKESPVPPQQTTYMCQAFDMTSSNMSVHMIGSVPILKNRNVIHHMIMYACTERPPEEFFEKPRSCFMASHGCIEILNLWAFGIDGECFNEKAGVLVGGHGHRYAMLEVHWNNPEKKDTYTDSSGLSVYFTEHLREYNQGSMSYGELELVLPPEQPLSTYEHKCPAACTRAYHTQTRYITSAMIHMHEFGNKGRVTLFRDGKPLRDLLPMHDYDYDSPILRYFDPPVEYLPGDEVKTECHYSTVGTNHSVFWGFDTSQEMCFSFINYYPNEVEKTPIDKLNVCHSLGGINMCMMQLPGRHVEAECDVTSLQSGAAGREALAAMRHRGCDRVGCELRCRQFLNDTFWPGNACFDPRRSKRMAETVSTRTFLADSVNRSETVQNLKLALHMQSSCEQEVQFLAGHSGAATSAPRTPTTTQPPTLLPRKHCGRSLSQNQLFIIILVSVCLLFSTVMLGMLLVALRLWKAGNSVGTLVSSSQYELAVPPTKN